MKKFAFAIAYLTPVAALAGDGASAPDGVGSAIVMAIHYVAHVLGI